MLRIAIYGRAFNPEYIPGVRLVLDMLGTAGCEIQVHQSFYEFIDPHVHVEDHVRIFSGHADLHRDTRFLLSLGGDGTLLDTITLVRDSGIPVAGVNMGRLGFLSSTSRHEISRAVTDLLEGRYTIDARSLIRLESHQGLFGDINYGLNEASVYKNVPNSMISVHAWVDGTFLNSYWADGLIIATPTGSTAYSLSCGGPIIAPGCANFLVTPIASHNLTVRPIVIPDSSELRIRVDAGGRDYNISLDSRMETLSAETEFILRKARFSFNLVRLPDQSFFRTIRDKLAWGLDVRN